MNDIRLLSLVVPTYRQPKTIRKNISHLRSALNELHINYEIIVVVDGKEDKTYENAARMRSLRVRVLGLDTNQGKGFAVKYGMMKARGDVIGFIDAGMEIDPAGIEMLLNHMRWYEADVIVGSKLHPVSQVYYPLWRKILSWGYRNLTRLLFGFKVRDTQVGIKFFKRRVVLDVFPTLLVKRFAFDVEVLAASISLGYKKIYEAPIKLNFKQANSSITMKKFWRTIFYMLLDTAAVFYRVRILNYYVREQKKRK